MEFAFKVIDDVRGQGEWQLANLLARRNSKLGPLWLSAMITGAATPILRATRSGQMAVDYMRQRRHLPSSLSCLPIWRSIN